jgi:hypothetical protein
MVPEDAKHGEAIPTGTVVAAASLCGRIVPGDAKQGEANLTETVVAAASPSGGMMSRNAAHREALPTRPLQPPHPQARNDVWEYRV